MSLFLDLRKHGKLAEKRNPMYEKSKFGKFWMYFMFVFWAGYLIFFGTTFAFAFDGGATEAYHVMNSGLIFVLVLDFLIRLPFQKTPTQALPAASHQTESSYRLPADPFRTGWLQSVLAVSVCSVFHHHRHQILWNQWCADLLHWHLAADGIQ